MKTLKAGITVVLLLLVVAFVALAVAPANVFAGEGAPPPLCYPSLCYRDGGYCHGDQGPKPHIAVNKNSVSTGDSIRKSGGEGAPVPTCYPGKNCGD